MDVRVSETMSDGGRSEESPSHGLAKPTKEEGMEEKDRLLEYINKLLEGADTAQIRLVVIAAKGILRR